MNALVPLLCALLSQTDPAPAADAPAATAEKPAAAPTGAPSGPPGAPPGMGRPGGGGKTINADEVSRQLDRLKKMSPEDSEKAARKIADDLSQMAGVALPPASPDSDLINSEGFSSLSDVEQVRVMARIFDNRIVIGDARSLTLLSSFPFQLEDRSLASPDELHNEWLKNLRNKRTDVLTIYGVEVYTPAEMVKKYGQPPPRLAKLPLNQPKTLIAVSNLSGRASITVWRYLAGAWQVIGYTD
jgi:hypothetical protein